MRGWHRYVALTLVVVASACSNGDGTADPPSSTATRPTLAPAVTASIATSPAPTTTTVAATTTVVPTTTATTTAPSTTTTFDVSTLPKCEDAPNAKLCQGVTVPPPPDAEVILRRYRDFAQKHLEVQGSDNPDWPGLLEFVVPSRRAEAKAEIEDRFRRGEALNSSLGVTLEPRLSRLRYPDDFIEILDCRLDGSYWTDRASGQPLAGEMAAVRQHAFIAQLKRVDGTWYLSGYEYADGAC